jgi:anti-anti-sigma factor
MPISLDNAPSINTLRFEGSIDIAVAAELKDSLQEAIALGKPVELNLSDSTYMDITALQLFWAAVQSAKGSGTSFTVSGKVPEEIAVVLREAGFDEFPVPTAER